MAPPLVGQGHCCSLIINALMWLLILLTIIMSSWPKAVASQQFGPLPLPLPLPLVLPVEHGKSDYHEPATEALSGLAGYERNYYGGTGDDFTRPTYGNYGQNIQTRSAYGTTANGFVPFPSSSSSQLPTEAELDVEEEQQHQAHHHHDQQQGHNIDFVFNTANYEGQGQTPASYYHNFAYQPREQPISNYREDREQHLLPLQARHAAEDQVEVYTRLKKQHTLAEPVKRHQQEPLRATFIASQQQQQQQDQQSLHSQPDMHIVNDLPHKLPPITTSIHHTASSSKALAGIPLAKHIEITKHVPITQYQKQHVPYKQNIQIQVPRTVINTIPKPMPIKVPISKTVAVPQLQEVKIPIEKIKPVPVERPMPFVVERRVPYRVEKPVATPFYYPYPVKVPIVRTIVHKQRPHYIPGLIGGGGGGGGAGIGGGGIGGWSTGNHLLGK